MPDEQQGEEPPPDIWPAIRQFAQELEQDRQLAERFEGDPAAVLGERGIDVALPEGSGFRSLGEVMTHLDPEARLATMDALAAVSGHVGVTAAAGNEPQAVITFVNVVANANVTNNANANNVANHEGNLNMTVNSNQHSNTSGSAVVDLRGVVLTQRVTIFDEFSSTRLAEHLGGLRLTPARQLTLLKRIALDEDSLVESRRVGESEFRLSRYVYRGDIIEVESLVTRQEVQILAVRLV